jgi:RNA polymerase sigma-70 factor (ECF subfamily)
MTEGISASGTVFKNILPSNGNYDDGSSSTCPPFKHRLSHRHLTPGMLTHLEEPETAIAAMPSPHSDRDAERELIARARAGDVGAFERLYHANAPRVFGLALRLTGNRQEATELTQDVFVNAWQRLTTFRGDAALASWLHRITVNSLFMRVRGEQRRATHLTTDDDSANDDSARVAATHVAPARPVDVDQAVDLERAIAALPLGARRVFVLYDILGYRHEEIAQLTGLAQGTLRSQLHRARRLLLEALEK